MSSLITNPAIRNLFRGVLVWAPLWISTTLIFGCLGLAYVVFFKHDTYLASQALLVRDEATGAVMRLGRFQSQTEMKAAQETILEMAKSQQVVRDALIAVGPPKGLTNWFNWGEYPSKDLVEEIAKNAISVHAPKGTEFGVTEVIYMDVKANSQAKAMSMCQALTDSLESRLQQVRRARADGVLAELTHARDSAKRELEISTGRLHEIESEAGSDLSDLRGMTDMVAGASTSRAELDQTKNDLRQAEINRQSLIADRELLVRATKDPTSFIVAPGAVLNSQPGLKRLREGLVDAQLSGSQLTGKFTESHPSVIASQSAQSSIVKRFLQELSASIAGVESDIALVDGRIERLENQKKSAQERLAKLADSRAPYANLLSEVKSKVGMLESSERELAEIQAARDSSVSTSLLTRLDSPLVSDRPIGPGKTTIFGLCTIAGLIFGLGIVFVVTPMDVSPVFGRRSRDRELGRRDADLAFQPISRPDEPNRESSTASTSDVLESTDTQTPKHENGDVVPAAVELPIAVNDHKKVNLISKANSDQDVNLADPFPNQAMREAYQPLIGPAASASILRPREQLAKPKSDVPSESFSVDKAFQELAQLKSRTPKSRSEELSLQMRVQELKGLVSTKGMASGREVATMEDESPRMKPRSTRTN